MVARDGIEPPTAGLFRAALYPLSYLALAYNACYRGSPRTTVRNYLHLSPRPFQGSPSLMGTSNANAF